MKEVEYRARKKLYKYKDFPNILDRVVIHLLHVLIHESLKDQILNFHENKFVKTRKSLSGPSFISS